MINSQRSDAEKINFFREGKRICINEVIKRNGIINNSLKEKFKMKPYSLKCGKDTKNINSTVSNTSNGKTMFFLTAQNLKLFG